MNHLRMPTAVLAILVLAGCGAGSDQPAAGDQPTSSGPSATPTTSPSPTPTPTPTPTATPTLKPTPPPAAPAADCVGTFNASGFTLSGRDIFSSDSGFSCNDGQVIGYERLKTSIRFSAGSKHLTLGPKKSGTLGGYRIRVGLANSKQATFTIDKLKTS